MFPQATLPFGAPRAGRTTNGPKPTEGPQTDAGKKFIQENPTIRKINGGEAPRYTPAERQDVGKELYKALEKVAPELLPPKQGPARLDPKKNG